MVDGRDALGNVARLMRRLPLRLLVRLVLTLTVASAGASPALSSALGEALKDGTQEDYEACVNEMANVPGVRRDQAEAACRGSEGLPPAPVNQATSQSSACVDAPRATGYFDDPCVIAATQAANTSGAPPWQVTDPSKPDPISSAPAQPVTTGEPLDPYEPVSDDDDGEPLPESMDSDESGSGNDPNLSPFPPIPIVQPPWVLGETPPDPVAIIAAIPDANAPMAGGTTEEDRDDEERAERKKKEKEEQEERDKKNEKNHDDSGNKSNKGCDCGKKH